MCDAGGNESLKEEVLSLLSIYYQTSNLFNEEYCTMITKCFGFLLSGKYCYSTAIRLQTWHADTGFSRK